MALVSEDSFHLNINVSYFSMHNKNKEVKNVNKGFPSHGSLHIAGITAVPARVTVMPQRVDKNVEIYLCLINSIYVKTMTTTKHA